MSAAKKILPTFAFAVVAAATAIFLSAPARYASAVAKGISLWAVNVLPATFPLLFLTALLTGLPPFSALAKKLSPAAGKLFRVSGAGGGAALLAALSGYPVGARLLLDLNERGLISKNERFRLACLLTTSGPAFLVGTVGSLMYGSAAAGWILLVAHLAGVWGTCFLLRFAGKNEGGARAVLPAQNPALLSDSLYRSVISVLCVGGFIAVFYCFGEMLSDLGVFRLLLFGQNSALGEGVCRGLLEMTSGCETLSAIRSPLSLATSCALVTFGGVCVLCQQATYLTGAGVRFLPFAAVKLAQAVFAFGICFPLAALFL